MIMKRLKDMTYILGSQCVDGVVLVADRKIVAGDGATHEYEDKLFSDIPFMVVGSSGTLGLFEKFRESLTEYMLSPSCERSIPALTTRIEEIAGQLNQRYNARLQGQDFDVLLGIKSTTGSLLRYIHPFGFAEPVRKYKVIGHGEPYGAYFLKCWWKPNMTMREVAELGTFIIRYIQTFELDNTVGVGDSSPQIYLIPSEAIPEGTKPDEQSLLMPYLLPENELYDIEASVTDRLLRLKDISWS